MREMSGYREIIGLHKIQEIIIMLVGSILTITGLLDLLYVYRVTKELLGLKKLLKKLYQTKCLHPDEAMKALTKGNKVGKAWMGIKGIIKSSSSDKNIVSAVVVTDIVGQLKRRKKMFFQKIPFSDILQKADSVRPFPTQTIQFSIHDSKSFCQVLADPSKTNLSGALTERKTFDVALKESGNMIVAVLKMLYDFILSIFPFNIFKESPKTGERITYYGILDGDYVNVVGEAYLDGDGKMKMENPMYITKQLSFVIKRLKKAYKKAKGIFFILVILQIVALYYLLKKLYSKYLQNRTLYEEAEQVEELPPHHECIICYSMARSVVFKPCKHYVMCYHCYSKLPDAICPICKTPIKDIIRILKK